MVFAPGIRVPEIPAVMSCVIGHCAIQESAQQFNSEELNGIPERQVRSRFSEGFQRINSDSSDRTLI
ncbi:hypothetical protein ANANG_G00019560 [Anguilla anguilla]|uniref:Uncharacterized protein n=1 Tax=Anguilla anguilla TaxID=7936 RepID=A0A9D3N061_ANGAN|nr:hypothetical protein ANANG_G00019560 [Anguilla anguilla]